MCESDSAIVRYSSEHEQGHHILADVSARFRIASETAVKMRLGQRNLQVGQPWTSNFHQQGNSKESQDVLNASLPAVVDVVANDQDK